MPLLPGAEPYHREGGPVGVLLCHGLTGSPQSLRPWAEYLTEAGLTVSLPRLPGHGTTWQEMSATRWEDWYAEVDRHFEDLLGRCETVFLMGLSLGGCIALRLAEQRDGDVAGIVVVNPSLVREDARLTLVPFLGPLLRSVPGLGGDIKREGVTELAYDRLPVRALAGLTRLWSSTCARLGDITSPVLLFHSTQDHVVGPASAVALRNGVTSAELIEHSCPNSYHVATLDNDAGTIFETSLEFVQTHSQYIPERG